MIGIPFKMICNCNNNSGSSNPNPTPKQKFSANFGFVAYLGESPTGDVFSEMVIKNITMDGTNKEVEIKLPEGYAGKGKLKAVFVRVDKKGVSFEKVFGGNTYRQAIEYKPTAELSDTSTIDPKFNISQLPLIWHSAGISEQGEWKFIYDGTSSGDYESKPTPIKYKFTGDTSLLYF